MTEKQTRLDTWFRVQKTISNPPTEKQSTKQDLILQPTVLSLEEKQTILQRAKCLVSDVLPEETPIPTSTTDFIYRDTTVHVPAYSPLCQDPGLKLPATHQLLEKFLYALDHVVLFLFTKENLHAVVFHRLIPLIQGKIRRTITLKHLEQLLFIVPETYSATSWTITHNGTRTKSYVLKARDKDSWTLDILYRRRQILHARLVEHVYKQYCIWSSERGEKVLEQTLLARWPRGFLKTVPEIPSSASEPVSDPTEPDIQVVHSDPKPSLLERIRAKELSRPQAKATGKRIQDIVEPLLYLFATSKKTVMLLGDVSKKIASSHKTPLSQDSVISMIKELADKTCGWITVKDNGQTGLRGSFVKMDKSVSLQQILHNLNTFRDQTDA